MAKLKLLKIDLNEVQKAMEDVARNESDYFLDIETGDITTISVNILKKAEADLYSDGDNVIQSDKDIERYDMPEQIEREVELAIKMISDNERYIRIPERESQEAYGLMKEFAEGIAELHPHDKLLSALNGGNSFSRFKKALAGYPAYREKWFALNSRAMKKVISEWLESVGIKPEQAYYK